LKNSNEEDSGATRVNVDFSEPLRIDDRHSGDGRKTPKKLSAQVVEEFFNSIDGEQPFGGRGSLAVTGPIAVGRGTRLTGSSGPWDARYVPSAFARTETE